MPNIHVLGHILKYVEFHVCFVRDILLLLLCAKVNEEPYEDKPLLMHTERGECLTIWQKRKYLKTFL